MLIVEGRAMVSNQSSARETGRICLPTDKIREKPVLPNTTVCIRLQERLQQLRNCRFSLLAHRRPPHNGMILKLTMVQCVNGFELANIRPVCQWV